MDRVSNIVGIDDAPFAPSDAGPVSIVGAVFADRRLDGVLVGSVVKDGFDAAEAIESLVAGSRFREHVQLVMLQGVTMGGFNVVDVFALRRSLGVPVLVVSRREPDRDAVRRALLEHIPDGAAKWRIIERLGPMESCAGVFIQRLGVDYAAACRLIRRTAVNGRIPEPLRVAHLVAGAIASGQSRGRP